MLRFHLKLIVAFFATTVLAAVSLPSRSAADSPVASAKFITATLCAIQREDFNTDLPEAYGAGQQDLPMACTVASNLKRPDFFIGIDCHSFPLRLMHLTSQLGMARPPPSLHLTPTRFASEKPNFET